MWAGGLGAGVRSSWCRAWRVSFRVGWRAGVAGVRSSWCRAWRVSFRVGWRAGCGGQVQLVSRMAGVLSCGLAGWVRGSGPVGVAHGGCPFVWAGGLGGGGQVQLVSRMAGVLSCGLAGWVRGSGPVGVAHGGCPFVWAGGLGAGVRSSWCRAWRVSFRVGWRAGCGGQVQLVSRMAGVLSCGLAGWVRGSGPVGVAHGGCPFVWAGGLGAGVRSSWCRAWPVSFPMGWRAGGGAGVRSSWCRASRVSFRVGWRAGCGGQVQLVSRIAVSCSGWRSAGARAWEGSCAVLDRARPRQACWKISLSTHLNPQSDRCKRPV